MYDYIWPCMIMHNYVWIFMANFVYVSGLQKRVELPNTQHSNLEPS